MTTRGTWRGPKPHKYGAKPTTVDGVRFDSQREASRYAELKLLERAGEIHRLELQPTFRLRVGSHVIGTYRADFAYCICASADECFGFNRVVEDVKSPATKTPLYRWKAKHVKAQYGIEIQEV